MVYHLYFDDDKAREEVWQGDFLTLWSDGTLSHDDGVGYLGETSLEDTRALYQRMKELFEGEDV